MRPGDELQQITPEQWQQLRDMCQGVLALSQASGLQRARAGLMIAESYWWQGLAQEA
jgi:hypothetical protein